MIFTSIPSVPSVTDFIARERGLALTYTAHGATKQPEKVAGFDNDLLRVQIGTGDADFNYAAAAIRQWKMFPAGWTRILPENTPIENGSTVAMFARAFGLWWRNSCQIVYVLEETNRFGFAYGTLPGHIECGEELFLVEQDEEGKVWYTIKAFSHPRHILARLGYPLMRRFQERFRQDSAAAMRQYIQQQL